MIRLMKIICIVLASGMFYGINGQIPLDPDPCWIYIESPNKTRGAALGDINNDGYLDLAVTREDGFDYIFINQGGSLPGTPSYALADSGPHWGLAFGDYDNDGDLDLTIGSCGIIGGRIRVYRNENGVINPNAVWVAPAHGALWVGWADVDNDGDLDLAAADLFQFPSVFRNNDGILEDYPFWEASDYNIDLCGCWFDVDNDGDLDLAIGQSPETYPMRLYLNDNGVLETAASWTAQPPQNYSTGGLAAGDVNKDGWLDLFQASGAGGSTAGSNYLYINQGGTLETVPSWISADVLNSTGIQFGDLDGNGYLDLAGASTGPLVVYRNDNGGLISFPDWISNVDGGAVNAIALGNIDNDGIGYYVDTIPPDTLKKLYYLSRFPVHKIDSIKIDDNLIPLSDYCYSKESGWISLKNTVPQGGSILLYYTYSVDMELGTCNYLFNNNLKIEENEGLTVQDRTSGLEACPNPFGEKTTIRYMRQDSRCKINSIKIYNSTGQLVKSFNPGSYNLDHISSVTWYGNDDSGRELSPGIYFVRLQASYLYETKKVIKLK